MHDYLKEYQIALKTVGPVFIGSGKTLSKKEYILTNKDIIVMDVAKLYTLALNAIQKKSFEEYYLQRKANGLGDWLKQNKVSQELSNKCVNYRMKYADSSLDRGTSIDVVEFMRDAYGLPFVPGSSIKGMLRTIFLSYEMKQNEKKFNSFKEKINSQLYGNSNRVNRNSFLRQEQKQMEAEAFCKLNRSEKKMDAVNDILSGLIVSDSAPIDIGDMILCQRLEYHVDGEEKNLNVLRECIKPGKEIRFSITIDETICPYTIDEIEIAIQEFSHIYDSVFKTKFHGISPSADNTVYLGGGTGFVSKTDVYPLLGEKDGLDAIVRIFELTKVPKMHKHYLDKKQNVSPHILKMTKYNGSLYHMGECQWNVIS